MKQSHSGQSKLATHPQLEKKKKKKASFPAHEDMGKIRKPATGILLGRWLDFIAKGDL